MFERAAPIQSPAICDVRSVIRFLNAKGERPADINKQNVAVYGNVTNQQNVTSGAVNSPKEGLMFTMNWLASPHTSLHLKQRTHKYMICCHIAHNNGRLMILIRDFS